MNFAGKKSDSEHEGLGNVIDICGITPQYITGIELGRTGTLKPKNIRIRGQFRRVDEPIK